MMYCPLTLYGMKATGKPLHDVLPIDPVWHESYWPCVTMLICGRPNTGWLNNYVVDDAARDQKVGGEDEGEDGPGGGSMKPCWLFDLQIRYGEDRKYGA